MGYFFNESGLYSEDNKELSPEKAVVLGNGLCGVLGKKIAIGSDFGGGSAMIKNALISGIMSGGGVPLDFGCQSESVTRSGIRFYGLGGGVHISEDGRKIEIFGKNGVSPDLPLMQKIMQKMSSGKITPPLGGEIMDAVSLPSYKLYFLRDIINNVKYSHGGIRILVRCPFPTIGRMFDSVAAESEWNVYYTKESNRQNFGWEVKNGNFNFGVFIENEEEQFFFTDEKGRFLTADEYDCLCMSVVFELEKSDTYVCSVSAPRMLEEMAKPCGGKIIRIKDEKGLIMSGITEMSVDGLGARFLLKFSPVGASVKIADYLCFKKKKLSEIKDGYAELNREKPVTESTAVQEKVFYTDIFQ